MKKTILIFALTLGLFACSKHEDPKPSNVVVNNAPCMPRTYNYTIKTAMNTSTYTDTLLITCAFETAIKIDTLCKYSPTLIIENNVTSTTCDLNPRVLHLFISSRSGNYHKTVDLSVLPSETNTYILN